MPNTGNTPSIVDDIANEIVNDIPAPIRDESEAEPFNTYVEGVAITAQTGTFMHVEGHVESFLTPADLVGLDVPAVLANDMHDHLA